MSVPVPTHPHVTDDDREVFAESLAWFRGLDLATAGPDTRAGIADVAEVLHVFEDLAAADAAPEALQFVFKSLAHLLILAQVAHERETGTLIPEGEPITADEFHRRHIAPIVAEARRTVRVIRRQARAGDRRAARCQGRPRARRRRAAARRAAGIRSGADPGSEDDPLDPEHDAHAAAEVCA